LDPAKTTVAPAIVAVDTALDGTLAIAVFAIGIDDPLADHAVVGRAVGAAVRRLTAGLRPLAAKADAAANKKIFICMAFTSGR
jgi:hypothetical protein